MPPRQPVRMPPVSLNRDDALLSFTNRQIMSPRNPGSCPVLKLKTSFWNKTGLGLL